MLDVESTRKTAGYALAAAGAIWSAAGQHIEGLIVSGLVPVALAISGVSMAIYSNVKSRRRDEQRKDLEARLELEELSRKRTAEIDEKYGRNLSEQLRELKENLDESRADHEKELAAAARVQAELQKALDVANHNAELAQENAKQTNEHLKHLRESLHATNNKLQVLTLERDELQHRLADLQKNLDRANGKLSAADLSLGEINRGIEQLRRSDSGVIPTDLAPDPDEERPDANATPPRPPGA